MGVGKSVSSITFARVGAYLSIAPSLSTRPTILPLVDTSYFLSLSLSVSCRPPFFTKGLFYRPYQKDVLPTEVPLVIYATLGEGHHNFHHLFPQDYATSEHGWGGTFNPSKHFIDIGASWGMVSERLRIKRQGKKWVPVKIKGYKDPDA